ncbi:MAG: alanine dehydrogenase [Erysipelotrichaceae bacterium]|nr:alanine dehydrogenase [Erysipelotrichaceae bacterium]
MSVYLLVMGHRVFIETGAGEGSGYTDQEYVDAGATILETAKQVWSSVDMMVKVKEPLESEYELMKEGLILYTYLHLAANEALTKALLKNKVTSIAYETITDDFGGLPLLKPMSEVAGRLSVQEGAKYLEKPFGGRGVLLSGVPGVPKAKVVIIGGGVVGTNAAKIAVGMGAEVSILDRSIRRLEQLDTIFGNTIQTLYSTPAILASQLETADLVIGAVLIPGASAPKLVKKDMLKNMRPGSVIVDVAIDQGGCIETSKITYHDNPTFIVDGVVHYCVANMPGATPRTSTQALTNATLDYGLKIASGDLETLIREDKHLANGFNTYLGHCVIHEVASATGVAYTPLMSLLSLR